MTRRHIWMALAITLIMPAHASAQVASTAPTFGNLQRILKVGDRVKVTDEKGTTREESPGLEDELIVRLLFGPHLLTTSIATEVARLNRLTPSARQSRASLQAGSTRNRNWVQRHSVLVGTLVGFSTGFFVGYLPGNDGIIYGVDAGYNGLLFGGIGAGVGALVGSAFR